MPMSFDDWWVERKAEIRNRIPADYPLDTKLAYAARAGWYTAYHQALAVSISALVERLEMVDDLISDLNLAEWTTPKDR
jgi:hypothetical protein